jgi:hypothetical protein
MDRTKKLVLWVTGVIVVIIIVLLGHFLYGYKAEDYLQRRPFVSSTWQDEGVARKPPYPCLRMVDDLLNKEKLIGQTRKEVVVLLGEPKKNGILQRV